MKMLTHVLCLLPLALPALLAGSFALMGHAQTVPPAGGNQPADGDRRREGRHPHPQGRQHHQAGVHQRHRSRPAAAWRFCRSPPTSPARAMSTCWPRPTWPAPRRCSMCEDDAFGDLGYRLGAAFLVPYPNRIRGKLSADGKTLTTEWEGHTHHPAGQQHRQAARRRAPRHARADPQGQDRRCQRERRFPAARRSQASSTPATLAATGSRRPISSSPSAHRRGRGRHHRGAQRGQRSRAHGHRLASLLQPALRRPHAGPRQHSRLPSWPRWTTTTTSSPPASCCPSRARSSICAPAGGAPLATNFFDDNWSQPALGNKARDRAGHRSGRALWRQHRGPLAGDQDHPGVRAADQATSWPSSTSTTSPIPLARSGARWTPAW